jgi:hypothetical protein
MRCQRAGRRTLEEWPPADQRAQTRQAGQAWPAVGRAPWPSRTCAGGRCPAAAGTEGLVATFVQNVQRLQWSPAFAVRLQRHSTCSAAGASGWSRMRCIACSVSVSGGVPRKSTMLVAPSTTLHGERAALRSYRERASAAQLRGCLVPWPPPPPLPRPPSSWRTCVGYPGRPGHSRRPATSRAG